MKRLEHPDCTSNDQSLRWKKEHHRMLDEITPCQDLVVIAALTRLPTNPIVSFAWRHHDDYVDLILYSETDRTAEVRMLPEEMDAWWLLRERLNDALRELFGAIDRGDEVVG